MKKQIFAVCDPEADYARKLMDYLNRKKSLPFEVQAFTDTEILMDYAEKNHIELLLISAEAMCPKISELDIGRVILLTEGSHPETLKNYAGVYKYQASSAIVRETMSFYSTDTAASMNGTSAIKKATKILGVYSPLGGCLKTTFSLTLGQILAEKQAVLYLNLEEYAGFEEMFHQSFSGTLSDLLYYSRQGEGNVAVRLSSMIRSMGKLDFVPPVQAPGDIRGTLRQDWEKLIKEISAKSSYEVIVLDIGTGIEEIFEMLDLCSRVYMPVKTDPLSEGKIKQFENLAKVRDYGALLTKTAKLKLPYQSGYSPVWGEAMVWSELGTYTRELLERETL